MKLMTVILFLLVLVSACQNKKTERSDSEEQSRRQLDAVNTDREQNFFQNADLPNIVELVSHNDALGIFTECLMAAEMVEQLQGTGPYTVFAPRDEAFDALSSETLDSLLMPENREQILEIISHHICRGAWKTGATSTSLSTLQGNKVTLLEKEGISSYDGAVILSADIDAANGVVHIIDRVCVPE